MCGIFGYQEAKAGAVPDWRRIVFSSSLASMNDARGGHSWGVARCEGSEVEIARGLGQITDRVEEVVHSRAYFGHTRWATHGEKTTENAHPFEVGRIVGAHNGIIFNHEKANRAHERSFTVDSQHLFAHLDERRDFTDLEGYGSIEWIERERPEEIYLCRLRGGELTVGGIGEHKKPQAVVWSSDAKHLARAFRLAGITDFFTYKIEEGQVYKVVGGRPYVTDRKLNLGVSTKLTDWRAFREDKSVLLGDENDFDEDDLDEDEKAERLAWNEWREWYNKTA